MAVCVAVCVALDFLPATELASLNSENANDKDIYQNIGKQWQ